MCEKKAEPWKEDPLYTALEAGHYLGFHNNKHPDQAVRHLVRTGRLEGYRYCGQVRVRRSACDAFLESNLAVKKLDPGP